MWRLDPIFVVMLIQKVIWKPRNAQLFLFFCFHSPAFPSVQTNCLSPLPRLNGSLRFRFLTPHVLCTYRKQGSPTTIARSTKGTKPAGFICLCNKRKLGFRPSFPPINFIDGYTIYPRITSLYWGKWFQTLFSCLWSGYHRFLTKCKFFSFFFVFCILRPPTLKHFRGYIIYEHFF